MGTRLNTNPTSGQYILWKNSKKWILWYVMCRIFYGRRIFYGSRNFYHRKVHNLSYILHMYGFFISHVDQKLSTFKIQKSFDSLVFFGFIKYCIQQDKIQKKDKMNLTEANVVEKWNEWLPNTVPNDDEETDTDTFWNTVMQIAMWFMFKLTIFGIKEFLCCSPLRNSLPEKWS